MAKVRHPAFSATVTKTVLCGSPRPNSSVSAFAFASFFPTSASLAPEYTCDSNCIAYDNASINSREHPSTAGITAIITSTASNINRMNLFAATASDWNWSSVIVVNDFDFNAAATAIIRATGVALQRPPLGKQLCDTTINLSSLQIKLACRLMVVKIDQWCSN